MPSPYTLHIVLFQHGQHPVRNVVCLRDPAGMTDKALLKQVSGKAGVREGLVPLDELLLKDSPSLG